MEKTMDKIVALAKSRGFMFPGCELYGGFANTLPGLRRYLDYPHIASIACPKPMFFLNGRFDKLFPPEGVNDAFSIMHNVWKSQNADDRLKTEIWEMPHDCGPKVQEAVLQFLDRWL